MEHCYLALSDQEHCEPWDGKSMVSPAREPETRLRNADTKPIGEIFRHMVFGGVPTVHAHAVAGSSAGVVGKTVNVHDEG